MAENEQDNKPSWLSNLEKLIKESQDLPSDIDPSDPKVGWKPLQQAGQFIRWLLPDGSRFIEDTEKHRLTRDETND